MLSPLVWGLLGNPKAKPWELNAQSGQYHTIVKSRVRLTIWWVDKAHMWTQLKIEAVLDMPEQTSAKEAKPCLGTLWGVWLVLYQQPYQPPLMELLKKKEEYNGEVHLQALPPTVLYPQVDSLKEEKKYGVTILIYSSSKH